MKNRDPREEYRDAYAAGVDAGHDWWYSDGYEKPKPPYDYINMNLAWSRGFDDGSDDSEEIGGYCP